MWLLQLLRVLKDVDLFLMGKADRQPQPLHSHILTRVAELPLLPLLSETRSRFQGSGDKRDLEIFETIEGILKVWKESTAQFKVSLKKKNPTRENVETK